MQLFVKIHGKEPDLKETTFLWFHRWANILITGLTEIGSSESEWSAEGNNRYETVESSKVDGLGSKSTVGKGQTGRY